MNKACPNIGSVVFGLLSVVLLVSCGDKKAYQAQLAEANAKLSQLKQEEDAAMRELNEAKERVSERMSLLIKARHPESQGVGTGAKGSVDELDEIVEYFNRQEGQLTKELADLKREVDDLKKDLATYKATYANSTAK